MTAIIPSPKIYNPIKPAITKISDSVKRVKLLTTEEMMRGLGPGIDFLQALDCGIRTITSDVPGYYCYQYKNLQIEFSPETSFTDWNKEAYDTDFLPLAAKNWTDSFPHAWYVLALQPDAVRRSIVSKLLDLDYQTYHLGQDCNGLECQNPGYGIWKSSSTSTVDIPTGTALSDVIARFLKLQKLFPATTSSALSARDIADAEVDKTAFQAHNLLEKYFPQLVQALDDPQTTSAPPTPTATDWWHAAVVETSIPGPIVGDPDLPVKYVDGQVLEELRVSGTK
ncbi:MAG: hypothetical protein M1825_002384 [Sarcosagium campestre]|nr:MAG: hypothetical protein M1825_002384 [Sarcosagium campestre]